MKKNLVYIVSFLMILTASAGFCTETNSHEVRLVYFDDPYEILITGPNGVTFDYVDLDMVVPVGSTIKTGASTAELELLPNRSIIKLAGNTEFTVESLQTSRTGANSFTLLGGKMRAIAARLSGGGDNYSILTPSAVCGVRGTDFGLEAVPDLSDSVAVLGGQVEFVNLLTGETIEVSAGEIADVFAEAFTPVPLSDEILISFFEDLGFVAADPANVPGNTVDLLARTVEDDAVEDDVAEDGGAENDTADTAEDGTAETADAAEEKEEGEEEVSIDSELPPSLPDPPQEETAETGPKGIGDNALRPVYNFLGRFLGMELGTLTLGGTTYAKAVFLPRVEAGKFRMALYLPIIYNTNMMDPSDWYRPQGNNEWSFGSDQSGTWPVISDLLRDLALKIQYIEYGDYSDPFFIKIGNVENVTLGHGLLMRDYPFDSGFPAVRRIGVNTGLDIQSGGFEAVVNDLAGPQIMGGRIFVRPAPKAYPFALGLSSLVDLYPSAGIPPDAAGTQITYGNPLFLTLGLDLDFPVLRRERFALTLFSDIGALLPYYRESYGGSISPGFAFNSIFTGAAPGFGGISNYAVSAGGFGRISVFHYHLEYRMFRGIFHPAYFSSTYEGVRGRYVMEMADYMADSSNPDYLTTTLGVYGEFGLEVGKIFFIEGGYFWPWELTAAGLRFGENDFFHFKFVLNEGVIPFAGIYGSLTYDRTKFIPTLMQFGTGTGLSLFDAYTAVTAEIVYPIAPVIDIAFIYTTSAAYADDGSIIADTANPSRPAVSSSITIETRVHF